MSDVEAREHLSARLFDRLGGGAGLSELLGRPFRMTSVRTQHLRADTNAFALFDGPGGQRHAVLVADGSEPGVLSRGYLATTADGRTFVVSMMISDPAASVSDTDHVAELLALGSGAFQLME